MDIRNYLTCFWPGLSELWWRGRLSAIPQAIGFAIVLNSLLALTYLYPSWLEPVLVRSGWVVAMVFWLYSSFRSVRELPQLIQPRTVSDAPDRYADAQMEYLRGNWGEAETLLMDVLQIEPRDPPALLLLSGVYRHTGRTSHASVLLEELRRMEIADAWHIEIDAEIERIRRDRESTQSDREPVDGDQLETSAETEGRHEDASDAADLTAA